MCFLSIRLFLCIDTYTVCVCGCVCVCVYSVTQSCLSVTPWSCSPWGFPGGAAAKVPACQCRRRKRHCFNLQVRKVPWRRKQPPTPVFLPGESHGQRSLEGYSPEDGKESDTTEVTQHASTDCSLSGSSILRTSQARILEWAAISYSRGPS